MTSSRRRGNQDSESRAKLVDAASELLLREGIAAVTARKVAKAVGLSHQIVHYYFKTMDDLLTAIIDHGMKATIAELERAAKDERPLEAVAKPNSSLIAVIMGTELTIYASNKAAMRDTVSAAIRRYRQAQEALFEGHLRGRKISETPSPLVATIVVTSVLRTLVIEEAVGVTEGHRETLAWMARLFDAPALMLPAKLSNPKP